MGGVLLHITSLPNDYGIGTLGAPAFRFIDFLADSGLRAWQVLPIQPAGSGNSPYKPFSSRAGNALLIDLEELCDMDLIDRARLSECASDTAGRVDFSEVSRIKTRLLREAWLNADLKAEQRAFEAEHSTWIFDYALYMGLKDLHGGAPWYEWEPKLRFRDAETLEHIRSDLSAAVDYFIFEQMIFYRQWSRLKEYANSKDVLLIGDIPIYVSEDSADVWANPDIFALDVELNPISVAGCPPDAFSADGQLWGNPLYDWKTLEYRGFDWWIERLSHAVSLFDIIRIDHYRGFDAYWSIPYGDTTAKNGRWQQGPGIRLFDAVRAKLGKIRVIAEDLGFLTQSVFRLRDRCGFPGMKVMQFAFNPNGDSVYLPYKYPKNCVVYTGTHDNDTVLGWANTAPREEVNYAMEYLNVDCVDALPWAFIRGAWSSVADIAIAPMQDFLGLGSESRMNIPSTPEGNWEWQMSKNALSPKLAEKIFKLSKCYGRL